MAYSSRFRFDFTSRDGVDCAIDVLGDGYAGTADSRAVGGTVTLRRTKSGNIIGTSLTWAAECAVESEFADLYTSDPKAFKVELYRPGLIWSGYITPELYSEPVVAPPYDVTLTADDRIAELKLKEFEKQGSVAVGTLLAYLLAPSASTKVAYISSLKGGTTSLAGLIVNLDHMEGESYYDVLDALLETFNAVIYYDGAAQSWTVCRENDAALLTQGGRSTVGTLDPTSPTLPDFFPVGNMAAEVVPAKARCIVTANMGERIGRMPTASWHAAGTSTATAEKLTVTGNGSYIYGVTSYLAIGDSYSSPSFTLKFKTTGERPHSAKKLWVMAMGIFKSGGGEVTRYLNADGGWQSAMPISKDTGDVSKNETAFLAMDPSRAEELEYSISLPDEVTDEDTSTDYEVTGISTFAVYLTTGKGTDVGTAILTDVRLVREGGDLPGTITTTVVLGNGAREDDSVEVELSDILGDPVPASTSEAQFLNGCSPVSGKVYTSGAVASGLSFDDFTAVDHALSVCVPRLRFSGVLHGRATPMAAPPVFIEEYYVAAAQYAMMIEEYTYDILEGDLDFTALTFPAAALAYTSLTRSYVYGDSPVTAAGIAPGGPRSMSGRAGGLGNNRAYSQWTARTKTE